jgi:hypothetical protein
MKIIYANKLNSFLEELPEAARSHNRSAALERIEFARKHYVFPLTSEFLGVSMVVWREYFKTGKEFLRLHKSNRSKKI